MVVLCVFYLKVHKLARKHFIEPFTCLVQRNQRHVCYLKELLNLLLSLLSGGSSNLLLLQLLLDEEEAKDAEAQVSKPLLYY